MWGRGGSRRTFKLSLYIIMWYYNDEPFNMSEEDLENYQGFVYEVTEL